jgi:hypothetical protein
MPRQESTAHARPEAIVSAFLISAGVLLALTGAVKLWSAAGAQKVLDLPDPLFGLPLRQVYVLAGLLEVFVAEYLLLGKSGIYRLWLLWGLAALFVIYRAGLAYLHPGKPCSCLGRASEWLHLSEKTLDGIAKLILAYMMAGSVFFLVRHWLRRSRA